MKTKLEISVPGESDRHFTIDTRAIVGKGPSADISLDDVPEMQAQHFRIKLGPTDLNVRLASEAPPLTYEGRAFSGGQVPYGTDFYLNRVRFSCAAPKAENNTRVLVLGGGAVLAVGALIALSLGGASADYTTPSDDLQPIELFEAAAPCPATDPAGAARRAEQLERAAHAKRERYRFDAHDGLDAGRLFAQAANCYALSNDANARSRVEEAGSSWRQRVDEEFRAARLQLVTALQNKQDEQALAAVVSMRRILEGEPHPYATWLRKKELDLKQEIAKKKKKR